MKDINITGSASSPSVVAESATGRLVMSGDSYPENSFEFFAPIINWVESQIEDLTTPIRVELRLLYLNTSSVKAMMDIFDLLEDAHGKGKDVGVKWFYDPDNDRIAELAEEFKEDCTFPFEIVRQED